MTARTRRTLAIAVPLLVALGVGSAVILGAGPERRDATIPAGTTLVGALERSVSTESNHVGDGVALRITRGIALPGGDTIPAGATLRGVVAEAKGGGRIAGAPELTLRFTTLVLDGESHPLASEPFHVRGTNDAGESAATIGGGAVAGGLVGGLLGGRGSVLKGAVAGAVIGTGVAVATDGDDIVLPQGVRLRIRLTAPLTVRYRPTTA